MVEVQELPNLKQRCYEVAYGEAEGLPCACGRVGLPKASTATRGRSTPKMSLNKGGLAAGTSDVPQKTASTHSAPGLSEITCLNKPE